MLNKYDVLLLIVISKKKPALEVKKSEFESQFSLLLAL